MDNDNVARQEEEMNQENDAREEDTVSDVDSDTTDIERNDNQNTNALDSRISNIEDTLDRILGAISSIREAQGIMVENGAVIRDSDADVVLDNSDGFVAPKELDLLI